jgi:hypothetical protein
MWRAGALLDCNYYKCFQYFLTPKTTLYFILLFHKSNIGLCKNLFKKDLPIDELSNKNSLGHIQNIVEVSLSPFSGSIYVHQILIGTD